QKWCKGFIKELRAQLVVSTGKHWSIYTTIELFLQLVVVPIFLFQQGGRTLAKCLPTTV
ncbi:hypothetical protein DFH28DRAFT_828779, partial [Melampsora americana]